MTRVMLRNIMVICGLFVLITGSLATAGTTIETALANGGKATITFADHPPKTMTETPFAITLHDIKGAPIEDAQLAISLTMPMMPMPPNHPVASWADGAYRGSAVFTMAGAWQVNVDIERPGAAPQQVVFDIAMVIMK